MELVQSLQQARVVLLAGLIALQAISITPSALAGSQSAEIRVVAFGDSLTAGYMLQPDQSFPAQLQMALDAAHRKDPSTTQPKVTIINAGVSGDTTAAGLERLAWTLEGGADAVILELGANDALRGVDPKQTAANLDKILTQITANGTPVLLAGMKAPGNWGADYARDFDAIFPALAAKHKVALYPFFLDGVALNKSLALNDGMHPNAAGIAEIVNRIQPQVETLIAAVAAKKAQAKN